MLLDEFRWFIFLIKWEHWKKSCCKELSSKDSDLSLRFLWWVINGTKPIISYEVISNDFVLCESLLLIDCVLVWNKVTRLIPDAKGTNCNQEMEPIFNTKHSHILRVPFRTEKGVLRQWVSRFDVYPYLERFSQANFSSFILFVSQLSYCPVFDP